MNFIKPLWMLAVLTSCTLAVPGCVGDSTQSAKQCVLDTQATCLCPGAVYRPLSCTARGELYCDCGASTPQPLPDMLVDMPADSSFDMCDDDKGCDHTPDPPCEELLGTGELMPGWSAYEVGFDDSDLTSTFGMGTNRLCLKAAGQDVWLEEDKFYFISTEQSTDFDIKARITRLDGEHEYTKAGLMFRTNREPDSPLVMVQLTRSRGAFMLARGFRGDIARVTPPHAAPIAPHWIRMIRQRDTFYSYTSSDGSSWEPLAAIERRDFPNDGEVGVALASLTPDRAATVAIEEIELSAPPPDTPCVAGTECKSFNEIKGLDWASEGRLNPAKFTKEGVETLIVTLATGDAEGSLPHALQRATQRAAEGLYTIVEIDPLQVTTPIALPASGSPELVNTWVRGKGATLVPATPEGTGLVLNREVIVEGIHFTGFSKAIAMSASSGPDNTKLTGAWIHHNTFTQCEGACVALAPSTLNTPRHITLSYNVFGEEFDGSSPLEMAIDGRNTNCQDIAGNDCARAEDSLTLSVHHNRFRSSIDSGYPSGNARVLLYNNWIEGLREPSIQGSVLSRMNIFSGPTERSIFVFDQSGELTRINTESDWFEEGTARTFSLDNLPASMYPSFFMHFILTPTELKAHLELGAGPQ